MTSTPAIKASPWLMRLRMLPTRNAIVKDLFATGQAIAARNEGIQSAELGLSVCIYPSHVAAGSYPQVRSTFETAKVHTALINTSRKRWRPFLQPFEALAGFPHQTADGSVLEPFITNESGAISEFLPSVTPK